MFYTSKSPIGALGAATFWPTQLALLGIIPPTEVTQRLVLIPTANERKSALNTLLDLLVTKAPPLKHPVPKSVLAGRTFGLTNVLTGRTRKLGKQAAL